MSPGRNNLRGAGLGLRRALLGPLQDAPWDACDFFEVAPENWIGVGGAMGKRFRALTERVPLVCHGLSLSIGAPSPLDETFIARMKRFFEQHQVVLYSEHLSYCGDHGHLYDLMPIPFTEAAVRYVAERIQRVQDLLGRRIAMENISYYATMGAEMNELDFIQAVLTRADCDLLLDVNNIYVNSVNHRYDASAFLRGLPAERVVYFHVAGHYNEAPDLIVDTHGSPVIDPVWTLLDEAYAVIGPVPTLLERDFNIPPLPELLGEVNRIRDAQAKARQPDSAASVRQAS